MLQGDKDESKKNKKKIIIVFFRKRSYILYSFFFLCQKIKSYQIKRNPKKEKRLVFKNVKDIYGKKWKNKKPNVWMSHGDNVSVVPKNYKIIARSNNNIISIIENKKDKIYGLQFHPEVFHTYAGKDLLKNFFKPSTYTLIRILTLCYEENNTILCSAIFSKLHEGLGMLCRDHNVRINRCTGICQWNNDQLY